MNRLNQIALICSLAMLVFVLSCGHSTQLTSMAINPPTASVGPVGAVIPVQYTAYGTFIHPPSTVDVTKQVTWTSSVADVATVSSSGLVTPTGIACGTTNITATAAKGLIGPGSSDVIVTATAAFTVTEPNVAACQ
jgi:hypothetical protein